MSQQKHPKKMAILILAVHCRSNFIGNHSSPRRDRWRFHLWGPEFGDPPWPRGSQESQILWISSWWFFPSHFKKMRTVKMDHETPGIGMKIKKWNHHLDIDICMYKICIKKYTHSTLQKNIWWTKTLRKKIRYSKTFACFSMLGPAADGFGYGLWSVQPGGH